MSKFISLLFVFLIFSQAFQVTDAQNQQLKIRSKLLSKMEYNQSPFFFLTSVSSNYNFIRQRINQGDNSPLSQLRQIINNGTELYWTEINQQVIEECSQYFQNNEKDNLLPFDDFNILKPKDKLEELRVLAVLKKTVMQLLADATQHRSQEQENLAAYDNLKEREATYHNLHIYYSSLNLEDKASQALQEELNLHNNRESKILVDWISQHLLHTNTETVIGTNYFDMIPHSVPKTQDNHFQHGINATSQENTTQNKIKLGQFWDDVEDVALDAGEAALVAVIPAAAPLVLAANIASGSVSTVQDLANGQYVQALGDAVGTVVQATTGTDIGDNVVSDLTSDATSSIATKVASSAINEAVGYTVNAAQNAVNQSQQQQVDMQQAQMQLNSQAALSQQIGDTNHNALHQLVNVLNNSTNV